MNDPNGLIQWRGLYHLFYQHNPVEPRWGPIHWGHAVSDDLVHWRDWPIALAPTPGGPDADGCWSGCAVDNEGVPTLVYTGVHPQVQCLAISLDGLRTWQKLQGNPVIAAPPPGLSIVGQPWDFRDPWLWREDGNWYALIGSGLRDQGGTALLYTSPDLLHWRYLHPLLVGNREETGEVWECPNFFPLGDRHVMLVSVQPEFLYTYYFSGAYAGLRFTPQVIGKLDHGGYFYAAQTFLDGLGRRIAFGWLREGRSEAAARAARWAGVMSLPRVLTLAPDGTLRSEPAPELAVLRRVHHHFGEAALTDDSANPLDGLQGDCVEIDLTCDPGTADQVGLRLRCSPDGAEQTVIYYDRPGRQVVVSRERSSLDRETHRTAGSAPLALSVGELLRLHVFLDRSVIEIFANGGFCRADRIYPTRPDSLGLGLFARGGAALLRGLDVWAIDSIYDPQPAP
jgi:beta-fructofuranosidase